jgi:hypothetical protein
VVVVLPTVTIVVCGIIVEISLLVALSVDHDWINVGGIRIPFQVDPDTVIPVTQESVKLPVILFVSVGSDDMTIVVPLRLRVFQVVTGDPTIVVAPVSVIVHHVSVTGALAVTNDPVAVVDTLPKLSVTDIA